MQLDGMGQLQTLANTDSYIVEIRSAVPTYVLHTYFRGDLVSCHTTSVIVALTRLLCRSDELAFNRHDSALDRRF